MRKTIATVAALIFMTAFATSCSDDNNTSEKTSDCAINSVVMGTLNRLYTTLTANGKDTAYNVTVQGNVYPLSIDQINRTVFNSDSLPTGTDITKVTLSTFSADGIVAYRLESGKDTLFSTKDSIDFTKPRIFTVYSSDGSCKRTYTFNITVHNSNPEAYSWIQAAPASTEVAALEDMQIAARNGKLYLWGTEDGKAKVLTRDTESKGGWTVYRISGVEGLNTQSVKTFKNKFVALAEDGLATSDDGITWNIETSAITPDRILAVSDREIFVTAGNKAYRSGNGTDWTEDAMDDNTEYLPNEYVCSAVLPAANNPQIENIVCVGYADRKNEMWKKVEDTLYPENEPWAHFPYNEDSPRTLPYLKGFRMFVYDSKLFGTGIDGNTLKVYSSNDMARTWQRETAATILPKNIGTPTEATATTDNGNNIWIACSGTGTLWKGYLNRLKTSISNQAR